MLRIHGDIFVSRSNVYTQVSTSVDMCTAVRAVSLDRVAMFRLFLQFICGRVETNVRERSSIFPTFRKFFKSIVTMSKFEWTREKTKHLISLLKGLLHLWNVSQTEYKNRSRRTASIEQIAQQFNTVN